MMEFFLDEGEGGGHVIDTLVEIQRSPTRPVKKSTLKRLPRPKRKENYSKRMRKVTEHSSDVTLVLKASNGMGYAFDELVRRYRTVVRVVAQRCLRDSEAVDDVTQDAFMKAYSHLDRLEKPARFRSWLLQITANRARDYARKDLRRANYCEDVRTQRMPGSLPLCGGETPREASETLSGQETERSILGAIYGLPERYREVAVMRYLEELGPSEIAQELKITERTVKQRLQRARRVLRHTLREFRPVGR